MRKIWGYFWIISALLGGYSLWSVWNFPSENRNAFLFGLSKSKLSLCLGMAVLVGICVYAAAVSFSGKNNSFSSGKAAGILSYFILFGLILAKIFLTPPVGKTALERSLLERLSPIFLWGAAFTALAFILQFVYKFKKIWHFYMSSACVLICGGFFLFLSGGSILYALATGTGLNIISGTFYRQGVSLLEGHLVVPLLFLYPLIPLFTIFEHRIHGKKPELFLTVFSVIILWSAAFYFWMSSPFEGRSYFAPALREPNYNYYPSSDAENYDLLAQSILLGNGFRNGLTVVRPLYAAFLALLHVLFGNDYIQLTNGQIFVLALIPVFVFLIGKHLHNTSGALLAAAWVIWREVYSIRITHLVQVSNSRLLMSDLPTLLLTAVFIFTAVRWFTKDHSALNAMLCGGMIGTAMLLRTQCFVLLPALWLIFLFSRKEKSRKWFSVLFSVIGLLIVFGPWSVWGRMHPNTTENADVSEGQYLNSLYQKAVGEQDKTKGIVQIFKEYPKQTFQAIGSHFLNNEISSLLILPVRLLKPSEAEEYFYEDDLFWYRENARQTIEENAFLISVYIVIISFGVSSVCRKNRLGGTIPLLIHIVYNLGNAFAMTSGFRFILPVDWIMLLYFGFGCTEIINFFCRVLLFDRNSIYFIPEGAPDIISEPEIPEKRLNYAGVILLLALIGSILPLCDSVIPRRFEPKSNDLLKAEWYSSQDNGKPDLSQYPDEELIFLEGRAFYPRYYKSGEGDSGGSSSAKRKLDFDRMVWMFHDQYVSVLCLPLTPEQVQIAKTTQIEDPMDVKIAGIKHDDYIEVLEMRNLSIDK